MTKSITKGKKMKTKTAHEKKVELAKASAPQYGMYIDGGSVDKLIEAAHVIGPIVKNILESGSEEKTKRMAIELVKDSIPSVNHCNISNCTIDMNNNTTHKGK